MSAPYQDMLDKWIQHLPHHKRDAVQIEITNALLAARDEGLELGQRLGGAQREIAFQRSKAFEEQAARARADRDNVHACYAQLRQDLDECQQQFNACDAERVELWGRVFRQDNKVTADNCVICARTGYYCYVIAPIDVWHGAMTMNAYAIDEQEGITGPPAHRDDVLETLAKVQQTCAERLAWEGDFSQGPFVCGIPATSGYELLPVLLWKQENNGMTFVCSPHPIPWLDEH